MLFFGPAALLAAAVAYVGAVRTHTCGHDVLLQLDGAWRVLNGQRNHVDFFSAAGPSNLSHAMCYNRRGFALLALVLIEALEEPLGARRRDRAEFLSGFTFLAYRNSFSEQHKPPAEWLFGETSIVMVPKRNFADIEHYSAILRNYLPYVQHNFGLAAGSPHWWMYRRDRRLQLP